MNQVSAVSLFLFHPQTSINTEQMHACVGSEVSCFMTDDNMICDLPAMSECLTGCA